MLTRSIRTIAPVHKDTQDMIVSQVSVSLFISEFHFIKYVNIIIWYYDTRCYKYSYGCIFKYTYRVVLGIVVIVPAKLPASITQISTDATLISA